MQDDSDQDLAYTRSLGERLRAVRRQLGLSLEAVDSASGREFKDSALSSYERGDRTISVPRLRRLAELYGRTVDELLPRLGEPSRRTDTGGTIDLRDRGQAGRVPSGPPGGRSPVDCIEQLAAAAQDLATDARRLAAAARGLSAWLGGGTVSVPTSDVDQGRYR
jgi:transcriptional regulator with XRE-family HTH domain